MWTQKGFWVRSQDSGHLGSIVFPVIAEISDRWEMTDINEDIVQVQQAHDSIAQNEGVDYGAIAEEISSGRINENTKGVYKSKMNV